MKKVKVIYVDASIKPQNNWKGTGPQYIGDDSARLLQATIDEQEIDGYELFSTETINGHMGTSMGMMLFFKKVEDV